MFTGTPSDLALILTLTPTWIGKGTDSSPAISPDGTTAYIGSYDHKLYAVDIARGVIRWGTELGTRGTSVEPKLERHQNLNHGCPGSESALLNGTLTPA